MVVTTPLEDHYGILEVSREADETTIKKAYRKLVLQWHPDKHPTDREKSEEKIRKINAAYETLSNPFKRSQYDEQTLAFQRLKAGVKLNTSGIRPKMLIPREFMLSPVGHPEKFVRTVGLSVFVQSRADSKIVFNDFFKDARFSLWWLPEVNNMCRIRPTSMSAQGEHGGVNLNYNLNGSTSTSELSLSLSYKPETSHVLAVASPVFPGAYRFEAAQFPGHYLVYKPPSHLRMVGGTVDETVAIDFNLVDFSEMYFFINTEEVLIPAVTSLGGFRDFVKLDSVRADANVVSYFTKVLKKPIWEDEDFEIFFDSRPGEWDYDAANRQVRLRSKIEQLGLVLQRSQTVVEVAAAISGSAASDVSFLPLDILDTVLGIVGRPSPFVDVSTSVNILDAQKKILTGLPKACDKDAPFEQVMAICGKLVSFGGDQLDSIIVPVRDEAAAKLGELVSDHIGNDKHCDELKLQDLLTLCQMPLTWKSCGERLSKAAASLLESQSLEASLPLLKAIAKTLPDSATLAEQLGRHAWNAIQGASIPVICEALELLGQAGICGQYSLDTLEKIMQVVPLALVATIVVELGEKGVDSEKMRVCATFVRDTLASSDSLPPAALLRLTSVASKSAVLSEVLLDSVLSAAATTFTDFTLDDASKMLLAVAKFKGTSAFMMSGTGSHSLYKRVCDVFPFKLREFSSVQLIKVILAIGHVPLCRSFLEEAAFETVSNRLHEIPPAQMLLLTQGLLPLGENHGAIGTLCDFLAESLREDDSRLNFTADQLAKLALMLASKAPNNKRFWNAFCDRFVGRGSREGLVYDLSSGVKTSLDAALSNGSGLDFDGKDKLVKLLSGRTRSRDRSPGARTRSRDRSPKANNGSRQVQENRRRSDSRGKERNRGDDTFSRTPGAGRCPGGSAPVPENPERSKRDDGDRRKERGRDDSRSRKENDRGRQKTKARSRSKGKSFHDNGSRRRDRDSRDRGRETRRGRSRSRSHSRRGRSRSRSHSRRGRSRSRSHSRGARRGRRSASR